MVLVLVNLVFWFPSEITAREHGSNKKLAAQSCALSVVRQLYHLGVIEPYSGVTKKKEGETVPAAVGPLQPSEPEQNLTFCSSVPAGGLRGQRGSRAAAAAGRRGPGAGSPPRPACESPQPGPPHNQQNQLVRF